MRQLLRAWIWTARTRQRLANHRLAPREHLVKRLAPGRTFADIGCMWRIEGAIPFLAEESGARSVTGLDVMEPRRDSWPSTPAAGPRSGF